MQISRITMKILALLGLALALSFGSVVTAHVAGAQTDGYSGYDGYSGGDDGDTGGDTGGDTTPIDTGTTTGSLPITGGVQMLAVAGAIAAAGLTIRRLSSAA